jgi:hypothetical protein
MAASNSSTPAAEAPPFGEPTSHEHPLEPPACPIDPACPEPLVPPGTATSSTKLTLAGLWVERLYGDAQVATAHAVGTVPPLRPTPPQNAKSRERAIYCDECHNRPAEDSTR